MLPTTCCEGQKRGKRIWGGWALEFDKWLPPPTFSSSYSCFHRVPSQMKGLLEKICLFGRQGGTEEVDKVYSLDWSFYMGTLKEKMSMEHGLCWSLQFAYELYTRSNFYSIEHSIAELKNFFISNYLPLFQNSKLCFI